MSPNSLRINQIKNKKEVVPCSENHAGCNFWLPVKAFSMSVILHSSKQLFVSNELVIT